FQAEDGIRDLIVTGVQTCALPISGSTAYSLAAGGPILVPSVKAFVITPVSPHALTHRPLVVEESSKIVIDVVAGKEEAFLAMDRSEEHTSELQSRSDLVCRLLLEK